MNVDFTSFYRRRSHIKKLPELPVLRIVNSDGLQYVGAYKVAVHFYRTEFTSEGVAVLLARAVSSLQLSNRISLCFAVEGTDGSWHSGCNIDGSVDEKCRKRVGASFFPTVVEVC